MDQAPKYQGALEKQGKLKTWTWKKYWFVLKENQLTYVKSQDKVSSQGHIDLSQAHSARVVQGNHGYPLEIVTRSRTHLLSASSPEQRDKWLKVIHEAISWSATHMARTGSITSARASCNSLIEDDEEYGYSTVTSLSGSPSASSGYSSASSKGTSASARTSRDMSGDDARNPRDSGGEDIMYTNTNYTTNAEVFARNSSKSIVEQQESSSYEDVGNRRSSGTHKGLRRLHEMKTPSRADLPQSLTARESDTSGIYDEVSEPMANIAISHIVKGYANIARNKGTPPTSPQCPSDSDPYDEVFDAIPPAEQRRSKVVMRRSLQQQDSESEYAYANTGPKLLSEGLQSSDRDSLPLYAEANPPPISPKPRTPISPKPRIPSSRINRQSRLPTDVQEYFQRDPIPDIPHPRIELTARSAFDDLRQFLANNRGPSEFYSSAKSATGRPGQGIDDLRAYLAIHTV